MGNNSSPVVADWNGDGLMDLVVGQESTSPGSVRLYLNSGSVGNPVFTTYSWVQSGSSNISWYRCTPQLVDLNGDGKRDLVVGENNAKIAYYENVGTNYAPQFSGYEYLESEGSDIDLYYGTRLWVDDWDENGTEDLLVSDYDGWVYLYPGLTTGVAEGSIAPAAPAWELTLPGNPFSGAIRARFDGPAGEEASLRVYDQSGRMVAERAVTAASAGLTDVTLDMGGAPAGIYMVRLSAPSGSAATPAVLLR